VAPGSSISIANLPENLLRLSVHPKPPARKITRRKTTRNGGSVSEILSSWKEIAEFLGKGVRTAQRWERELGLPVRRPPGKDSRVVFALREELTAWVKAQPYAGMDTAASATVHEMPVIAGDKLSHPVEMKPLARRA
jgi:hypothetical protein